MKKVAILIKDITQHSGTERAVSNLASILTAQNMEVHIISNNSFNGDKLPYELPESVKIFHVGLPNAGIVRRAFKYVKFIYIVRKYLRANNIDILIGTGHQYNVMMYLMGKSTKKIACEHLNYEACPSLSNKVRRLIYPKLDAIVLLTSGDAANYRDFVDSRKIYIIPNSLPFISEVKSDLCTKRIIAVGRLTRQKNFEALIEASAIIKNSCPDWHVDIFGRGEDKGKLLTLISELSLENYVRIHEPVNDIKREYLASGLIAVSSIYEGMHMGLIEAEACGLPAVSFNCNYGPSEIIHDGIDGFLVNVGDVSGLAEKIILIAQDDDLRAKMGQAAFENAKNYEPEKIAEKWRALLRA